MDRIALVTGASSGIGEATVRQLLGDGYIVYAAARRIERMVSLAEAGARIVTLDVTDDVTINATIRRIESEAGRLDVLVNNAGYGSYGALEDVPLDEARRQFEVNLFGAARLIQLCLPMMRAQRSGRIVNITSIGGKMWEPFGSWYHATKFALEGLSDCLRMELKPFGIDVIVVEPGAIRTEWGGIAHESLLALGRHRLRALCAAPRQDVRMGRRVFLGLAAGRRRPHHLPRRGGEAPAHPLRHGRWSVVDIAAQSHAERPHAGPDHVARLAGGKMTLRNGARRVPH